MKLLRHPIRAIREPFGTAGLIVACVALVAALAGGAYAASGLNGKQKKEVEKIAKKVGGKPGPAGPAGANGKDGTPGAAGTKGNSVVTADYTGPQCATATEEGLTVEVAGEPATKKYVCDGEEGPPGTPGADGSPWVVGQAPSGVILKGTWSVPQYTAAAGGEQISVPISTGVPVPTTSSSFLGAARGGGLSNGGEEEPAEQICPGTADNPTINTNLLTGAGVGGVCVYAAAATNLKPPTLGGPASGTFALAEGGGGVVAQFHSVGAGGANGYGSWVMYTAP